MSQMVTNSNVTGTTLFWFLFRLKWLRMNEIRQNIPESELCFCFMFGIWIGTRVETRKQTKDSKGILGPGRMVEDASRWYGPLRVDVIGAQLRSFARAIFPSLTLSLSDRSLPLIIVDNSPNTQYRLLSGTALTARSDF